MPRPGAGPGRRAGFADPVACSGNRGVFLISRLDERAPNEPAERKSNFPLCCCAEEFGVELSGAMRATGARNELVAPEGGSRLPPC
jgi:hypothetical protein